MPLPPTRTQGGQAQKVWDSGSADTIVVIEPRRRGNRESLAWCECLLSKERLRQEIVRRVVEILTREAVLLESGAQQGFVFSERALSSRFCERSSTTVVFSAVTKSPILPLLVH
jgi:hypothetical protein